MGRPGNKNIANIGRETRFSSTNQPKKKGRRPNILTKLKSIGLSHDDIRTILENILMADKNKASEMLQDPELPLLLVGYLSALIKDIKKGSSITLDSIVDRLDGKATQKVEADATLRDAQPPAIYFGEEEEEQKQEDIDKED